MNNEKTVLQAIIKKGPMHIRRLSKETKLNPNTIINITSKLEKEGLVEKTREEHGNRVIIAGAKSERYRIEKISYNCRKIFDSGVIKYLNEELAYPTIVLFGSVAKGEDHEESDIDIFIIADEKKNLDMKMFEGKIDREMQIFLHTKKEFKQLIKTNKELINNVLNGIILSGYLEVL